MKQASKMMIITIVILHGKGIHPASANWMSCELYRPWLELYWLYWLYQTIPNYTDLGLNLDDAICSICATFPVCVSVVTIFACEKPEYLSMHCRAKESSLVQIFLVHVQRWWALSASNALVLIGWPWNNAILCFCGNALLCKKRWPWNNAIIVAIWCFCGNAFLCKKRWPGNNAINVAIWDTVFLPQNIEGKGSPPQHAMCKLCRVGGAQWARMWSN